jgi:hypothetical protein
MKYKIIKECLITIDNEEEFIFLSDKLLFRNIISFEDKLEFSIETKDLQNFIKNTKNKNKTIKEISDILNKENKNIYKYIFEFWKK